MKLFVFSAILVLCVTDSIAAVISSNGLQRLTLGRSCVFQWKVNESINSYNIYKQTTGSQTPLGDNANHAIDKINGVVTLTITRVQLSDAGNYSLVVTTATATLVDSTACLFVYGYLQGTVNVTAGPVPAREGDTLEVTCNLTSTSSPQTYRPDIYYSWSSSNFEMFRNISSGPAVLANGGDIFPRYTIKNNGRTLVISSVRFPEDQFVFCYGMEAGSGSGWIRFSYYPVLLHRPFFRIFDPASKKFNAIIGTPVELSFNVRAKPTISSASNWTFTNSAGTSQELPLSSVADYSFNSPSLRFNFTSSQYYGTYSITLSNSVGSTTTAFQVLPQGPPDTPSNVRLYYVSHCIVAVQWNWMWANAISRQQTVSVRLDLSDSNSEVQTLNYSSNYEHFNSTQTTEFISNTQPETNYKVSVWSTNAFGSSEVSQLMVRTRKQPKLVVLPETIYIIGDQMIVNFTVELDESMENPTEVSVSCCSKYTGQCRYNNIAYQNKATVMSGILKDQVLVNDIPNGTLFYVDVNLNSGVYGKHDYYSNSVKDIRVSRAGNADPQINSDPSIPMAVIVLAVLLGVAVAVLVVILIVYLAKKTRHGSQAYKPSQIPAARFGDVIKLKGVEDRAHLSVDDVKI